MFDRCSLFEGKYFLPESADNKVWVNVIKRKPESKTGQLKSTLVKKWNVLTSIRKHFYIFFHVSVHVRFLDGMWLKQPCVSPKDK